jgi:hypothetical protein
MLNLESIIIQNSNILEIPSHAFRPINGIQTKLSKLWIENSIERIGSFLFYYLNNLKELALDSNQIDFIASNAFHFKKKSNEIVTLWLIRNQLNSSSFALGSFNGMKRSVLIYLDQNLKLTFLEQTILSPLFDLNNKTKIAFRGKSNINCDECRSYLLKKESKYIYRTDLTTCSDVDNIMNSTNFKNCE